MDIIDCGIWPSREYSQPPDEWTKPGTASSIWINNCKSQKIVKCSNRCQDVNVIGLMYLFKGTDDMDFPPMTITNSREVQFFNMVLIDIHHRNVNMMGSKADDTMVESQILN